MWIFYFIIILNIIYFKFKAEVRKEIFYIILIYGLSGIHVDQFGLVILTLDECSVKTQSPINLKTPQNHSHSIRIFIF